MNVKLLRKVQKHILAEPKRLRMSNWIVKDGDWDTKKGKFIFGDAGKNWGEPSIQPIPKCGTVGCISGWARMLAKNDDNPLGLVYGESERLFYVSSWPFYLRDSYLTAKTARTRARITGERIDHFIATKGAE